MKLKISLALFFFLGAGWLLFGRDGSASSVAVADNPKPFVKFSHAKHVNELGNECNTCHTEVEQSTSLISTRLIPGHSTCQSCHEQEVTNNCNYCHFENTPTRTTVVVEREINFNHKIHATDQKMACLVCHEKMNSNENASNLSPPTMATCVSCHNNQLVTNECATCHRNLATLYPKSHSVGNFKKEHKHFVRLNTMEARCESCHTDNFCAQCHDGANLLTLTSKEKIGMVSPRTISPDKGQSLVGQMVHDINYRFTHSIDAKGKTQECQSCHRSQQFCNDCHANGSAALGGTRPVSHDGFGFVIVGGYGSGGGKHSEMARRDIEQCASCHDVQGSEPACMKCHIDNDGIKHTNPKTHADGFLNNVRGEWHDNAGANCYTCHIDANARPNGISGQGFCGYCHGKK